MIYDIFPYNGENRMLELRFAQHKAFVDKFIILDFNRSFSGISRDFIEIKVPGKINADVLRYDIGGSNNYGWEYEHKQRDMLFNIINKLNDNATLIYTDCDEIIRNSNVVEQARQFDAVNLQMDFFVWYYNMRVKGLIWNMGKILKIGKAKQFSHAHHIREAGFGDSVVKAGWHFNSVGTAEEIYNKYTAFSHFKDSGFQGLSIEKIGELKRKGIDPVGRVGNELVTDGDLPEYLTINRAQLIDLFRKESLP